MRTTDVFLVNLFFGGALVLTFKIYNLTISNAVRFTNSVLDLHRPVLCSEPRDINHACAIVIYTVTGVDYSVDGVVHWFCCARIAASPCHVVFCCHSYCGIKGIRPRRVVINWFISVTEGMSESALKHIVCIF